MLFSCLLSAGAADLAEFRAKQKGLLNLLYVLAALGVLTIVFGLFAVPRILPEGRRLYFFSGFYCGGGAGLTASVAWNIRRLRRTLRDETALRRAFTEQTDERNAMITNRAARAAGLALWAGTRRLPAWLRRWQSHRPSGRHPHRSGLPAAWPRQVPAGSAAVRLPLPSGKSQKRPGRQAAGMGFRF